jgi:hypothetical protein
VLGPSGAWLEVQPETLVLKSTSPLMQQVEGHVSISNSGDSSIEVSLASSSAELKVARNRVVIREHDQVNVRVLAGPHGGRPIGEHSDPDRLVHVGYLTVSTSDGQEFLVDIHRQCSTVPIPPTPQYLTVMSTVAAASTSFLDAYRQENPEPVPETIQAPPSAVITLGSTADPTGEDMMVSMKSVTAALERVRQLASRTPSAAAKPVQPTAAVTSESKAEDDKHQLALNSSVATRPAASHGSGVYFRRQTAHFGSTAVGTLTRLKIELCNATDEEVRDTYNLVLTNACFIRRIHVQRTLLPCPCI